VDHGGGGAYKSAMSRHHVAYRLKRTRERSLASLVLFATMLFVGAAGMLLAIAFAPNPALLFNRTEIGQPTDAAVTAELEDLRFSVPAPVVGEISRSLFGTVERIDLKLPWPDPRRRMRTVLPLPSDLANWVLVTLEPRLGRTALEDRLVPIYSNFLEEKREALGDLTRRAFKPGSPYADSELMISADGKVIRCDKRPSVLGPIMCERFIPLSDGVLARIRFASERLQQWREIEKTSRELLAEFAGRS
jgi:hypothetical protein